MSLGLVWDTQGGEEVGHRKGKSISTCSLPAASHKALVSYTELEKIVIIIWPLIIETF